MLIKNKITNLEYMFYGCHSLKDINELKYLDTKYINYFSDMFWGCSLLSDIFLISINFTTYFFLFPIYNYFTFIFIIFYKSFSKQFFP